MMIVIIFTYMTVLVIIIMINSLRLDSVLANLFYNVSESKIALNSCLLQNDHFQGDFSRVLEISLGAIKPLGILSCVLFLIPWVPATFMMVVAISKDTSDVEFLNKKYLRE